MNKVRLNSLFNRRIYASAVDYVVWQILTIVVVDTMIVNLEFNILLGILLGSLLTITLCYGVLPSVSNGFTIGSFLFRLRILHLNEKSIFKKIGTNTLKVIYASITFYPAKILWHMKINSLGQLYFDEKFNMTINEVSQSYDLNSTIDSHEVYFGFNIWKFFLVMLILSFFQKVYNEFF